MNPIDWQKVDKVLVVRLRSIGDTVLSTASLIALRRFLPNARIDILLEDWVAPLLDGFPAVNNVLSASNVVKERFRLARKIRKTKYDIAINLHGGTTAGFFVRASGAKYRIGYENYQYNFLYNHRLSSASDYWKKEKTHSAEQQLALLGFAGVPVDDRPKTRLNVTDDARKTVNDKLISRGIDGNAKLALIHPAAAFSTKQWATKNFAKVCDYLSDKDIHPVAVATGKENAVLQRLEKLADSPLSSFDDLSLPEITALAARSRIFVGNDSGIAHIAAAVGTPSIVIFGSSNREHWHPWTDAPNEIVFEKFSCQPCAGYFCKEFDEPRCILDVKIETVVAAIQRNLVESSAAEKVE